MPTLKFLRHQQEFIESTDPELFLSGAYGSGKAQPKTSKVLTPNGWVKMGDISIGDTVITGNGNPTKVLEIHPQGEQDIYGIWFTDKTYTECTIDHLWEVWTNDTKGRNNPNKILPLSKIINNYIGNDGYPIYFIPIANNIEFTPVDIKIHPYLLGLILGDGGISNNTINFTTADLEIIEYIKNILPDGITVIKRSGKYGYGISGRMGKENPITRYLREYNLMGFTAEHKFIPNKYKYNTIETRLQVLQGLFDTDGSVSGKSNIDYITVSYQLALDVQELVQSLGGRATLSIKENTYYTYKGERKKGLTAYRIYAKLPNNIIPFRLSRKADIIRNNLKYRQREVTRGIKHIELVGRKDAQCITVEDNSGLYITDNYIVTHNSMSLCAKIVLLSLRYPNNRGFLCRKTLQSLKNSTLKTLLDGDGDLSPILPKKYIKSHNKTDRVITLLNGSEIMYGNMDIEYIKSMNLGWAAVDEVSEISEDEWNALIGRLRLASIPVRQVFGATNPNSPLHWIWIRSQENENAKKKIKFIQSKTSDNKYLPKEYIDELERTLFGHFYQRFFLGNWVGSGKLVYDNFDPKAHIINNFDIPNSWKRYRTIDFGFQSPFSCLWIAQAGNNADSYGLRQGDLVVYKELYYTQRTVSINAEQIIKFSKSSPDMPAEKYAATISDWDSGDRADLEAKGIRTVKADKDISSGIQKVREWLGNTDSSSGPIIRPKLYFFRNILCETDPKIKYNLQTGERVNNPLGIIEEFQAYSWKLGKPGDAKEEPEDRFNHSLDALRYFMKWYDGKKQWAEVEFKSL